MSPLMNTAQRYAGPDGTIYRADVDGVFDGLGSRLSKEAGTINPSQVWRDQQAAVVAAAEPEMREAVEAAFRGMGPSDGYPLFVRLAQAYRDEGKAQELLRRAGFRGMSGDIDGPEILMFDSVGVRRQN